MKANRFGYVIKAQHGTRLLSFDELRRSYARTSVELSADRFVFLNTMFSYSEACLYAQLVDLLDRASWTASSATRRCTTTSAPRWTGSTPRAP